MFEDTRERPVETQLYWLSSRYYSPELCRFISPDDIEYLDPESLNGLNLYCYCANNPINHIDPDGHEWYHWAIGAVAAAAIIVLSVYTAGAILAAAPAIASYASTMAVTYTGIVGLGSAAATAVSIGAGVLAVGTVAVGVNEGVAALTGYNAGRELMGDGAYDVVSTTITLGGASYIAGGMTLPYPSTCHSPDYTTPKDLKEQMILNTAKSQPSLGVSSGIRLGDPRFPSWLGWEKYYYTSDGVQIHYVGNRFFPNGYPFSPWFDYKIKYHK